ncbi:hypothetical protein ISN44_As07g009390 [Arabidopsis suecica]|uniref:Uncharacterized protein n=1 Tax=Arabidopsis suecica TaxID=45249 RepID=A0A8T2BSJ9_ARASU|nr:hypothetical protein ISN44_As07g009390 [Arabidopsis suecica]
MTNDPETMLESAVNGAKFVIDAAAKAKFKRLTKTAGVILISAKTLRIGIATGRWWRNNRRGRRRRKKVWTLW